MLQASVRELDVVARHRRGVVVCQHVELHDAIELWQRITDELSYFHFYHNITGTCSFGLALLGDNERVQACVERADTALYTN
ncbi:diguanylate cyclase [Shewanella sp. SG41-4]|nr:diguanylate cyclase [Shewanella sp. SG41-4]